VTLPTFLVIGVAKAGTTSLFHYLDQHPEIHMYPDKATNYFGYEDACDWRWDDEGEPPLLRHFHVTTWDGYEAAFAGANGARAVGEVSPQYFRSPTAARRIHEALPGARLVVSLRNPAERAFSGYLMRVRRGEAVDGPYADLTAASSHVREGFYHQRLKRFFDCFPREQIQVLLFDDLKRDPAAVMREVFGFVGADAGFVPDTGARHKPANVPRSRMLNRVLYRPAVIRTAKAALPARAQEAAKRVRQLNLREPPTLPDDLRARLLEIYREDIERLEALVDRDLSVWLRSSNSAA